MNLGEGFLHLSSTIAWYGRVYSLMAGTIKTLVAVLAAVSGVEAEPLVGVIDTRLEADQVAASCGRHQTSIPDS